MWHSVLDVLESVYKDGIVHEKRGFTSALIDKMGTFGFVFNLHLMKTVLGITNDLSINLQLKDQNIINAVDLIVIVKKCIQNFRENGWDDLLKDATNFCIKVGIPISNMEDTMLPHGYRFGREMITCYHHYHNEVFMEVVNKIVVEMDDRFNETTTELLSCMSCLDPKNSFSRFQHDKLLRLAKIYSNDFSEYDLKILKDQLHNYIFDMRRRSDFVECCDRTTLAEKMVETQKDLTYPLNYRLIELTLILPVATTSVERAFSLMKIIKTDLRNKMGDEWMNDMIACYIERQMFEKIEEEVICNIFRTCRITRFNF